MNTQLLSALAVLGLVAAPVAAGQSAPVEATRITMPVRGLDAENGPTIERALKALESEGEPPHRKLLTEVAIDAEKGVLALVVAPGQSLRLKQVERSLNATGVRLASDRFALGASTLVIEGEAGEDPAPKLQRALTNELFAKADVRAEGDSERIVAQVEPGEEPPTLDSAVKAVRTVAPTLRIADVIWKGAAER